MYFEELELRDFRNYEHQTVRFHKHINVIQGKNAQGKTNLLEALYIMSSGRSFRTLHDGDLIRFGCKFASARSVSVSGGRQTEIEIGFTSSSKSIRIDGIRKRKTSELLNHVYVVIFSPDDLRIIKDEPSRRRKFMDRELCQIRPVYWSSLAKYNKALQQRNALLKSDAPDPGLLAVWDEELAEYGSSIMMERAAFTADLSRISGGIHQDLTEQAEQLTVHYEPDIPVGGSRREQRDLFRQALLEHREKDLFRRTTGRGPHRDDLSVHTDGISTRNFGSQGQQRTAALSLKLAEIEIIRRETGEYPVLLLDDVLSELDHVRKRQLISTFENIQIIITAADMDEELEREISEHAVYHIEKGSVIEIFGV